MKIKLLGAAVVLALMTLSPASAQRGCAPKERFIEVAATNGAIYLTTLTGDAMHRAVEWYNSQPPESDHKFDLVIVAPLRSGAGMIGLGYGDKICEAGPIDREAFRQLLTKVLGIEA